jgi:urease accessory protein
MIIVDFIQTFQEKTDMRNLVKKLDASNRLAPALLARAPSFKVAAGALADALHEVMLTSGETVHLQLPSHTHLNPGDVLLDSMGMMVRVDAAAQAVLAVSHSNPQAMVSLALSASNQGRALGWDGSELLLALDNALAQFLHHAGFDVSHRQGTLNMPLAALPEPEHACGHEAHAGHGHAHGHSHAHNHDHGHAAHVHGPDCQH